MANSNLSVPMPGTPNLVVDQRVRLDYDRLSRAIQEASGGFTQTVSQGLVLAEIRACRQQVSSPLDANAERAPSPTDRARISGLGEITITLSSDSLTEQETKLTEIRLGPDLVSVAFALSDELHINEFDAAVLLSDARSRAAVRPDRDVVLAAKEMAVVRRRHAILYLQEIIRAGLMASDKAAPADDSFIAALMRERDLIVVEHNTFSNLADRIRAGWVAASQQPPQSNVRTRLEHGEFLLLAETIFLLAYTVQLSAGEAILLRSLLKEAEQIHETLLERHHSSSRPNRNLGIQLGAAAEEQPHTSDVVSPALVEAESVRNLLLLAWMSAIDRSRYHDTYDPRTATSGVNRLLKDTQFVSLTNNVPKSESDEDYLHSFPRSIAAAELCSAVFRLAVAEPDESEAVTTFLTLAAYNHALSFLADSLTTWISKRAGSLSPDADLYADVLEDLANDIAEAPHILTPIVHFVIQEVQHAASVAAYMPMNAIGRGAIPSTPVAATPGAHNQKQFSTTPGSRRARHSFSNSPLPPSPSRRLSSGATPSGRPPRPPSVRNSRPSSITEGGRRLSESLMPSNGLPALGDVQEDVKPNKASTENLMATLAHFVARAIALAPTKLGNNSVTGGLRYWATVGPANFGFIQRVGDSVMDLWDLAMRNPYAPGGVGDAFRQALNGYMELLASSCQKQDSPLHAMAALRFLAEGGHGVVSLEQLMRGLSHVNSRLGGTSSDQEGEVDDVDCEILRGIVNIIAHASNAVSDHGGIMAALGERGKELAMSIGALAVHNVSADLKETLIRCLGALGDQRPIVSFLEAVAKHKAGPLRHFLRCADSQSGEYDVTLRILELTSLVTSWSDEEFPDAAVESVTRWFAIEEVLMYWSRRKYVQETHRWQVVHAAGSLVRDLVYRDLAGQRTSRVLAHLLTPAPGTGAASFSLKTLVCATGLIRTGDESSLSNVMGAPNQLSNSLYHVSGRSSLVFAADHGLGEAYRVMQEAVRTSARLISLLLEISPGRMSVPGVSIVSAAELLDGELSSIAAAASLVFNPDCFTLQFSRAGYSPVVCAAVLAMLSRAASESENVANIFAKDPCGSDRSATEFRASLGNIIAKCDPNAQGSTGTSMFSIESKENPDRPLMYSALALVESCLGRDGSSAPGIFLLGLRLDSSNRYESADYGVLGALVELVANPQNGDERIDSMSRATAATFLERLAANTVRGTSLAVLEHLKDVCASDKSVRGGGFADEMLFSVIEPFRTFEPQSMGGDVNWTALGSLVGACLSLSSLQVRVFPEYELERCFSTASQNSRRLVLNRGDSSGLDERHDPPCPLELLRVLHTMAGGGDVQVVFEAFRNWFLFLGARLAVHEKNQGYYSIPLLFEVANAVLDALSQSGSGSNLSGVVKKDGGEVASAVVLLCLEKMRVCGIQNRSTGEDFVSDSQCGTLLSGIIRALAEVTGVSSTSARARTSLYTALLICGGLAEERVSEDAIGRALGGRIGQKTGTEVVIEAACVDAVSGGNAGTKCSGLACVCMVTRLDGVHAVMALETQNRLRKVVQECLGSLELRNLIWKACWESGESGRSQFASQQAAVAVAGAMIGVIHAVSGSGHGTRILAECGCVDAIANLLPRVCHRHAPDENGIIRPSTADLVPRNRFGIGSNGTTGDSVPGMMDQRKSLINGLTGAFAAALASASWAADSVGSFVVAREGRSVFVDLLTNVNLPGCVQLETISNVGMIVTRLADEIVVGSGNGVNLGGLITSLIGAIIPDGGGSLQKGASGFELSTGVNVIEPENTREARRLGINHPEGGSLLERDLVGARAQCAQDLFAAVRAPRRVMSLFEAEFDDGRRNDGGVTGVEGGSRVIGNLYDVVRICKTMIREAERLAEESLRIESRLTDENGASINSERLNEIGEYCFEEHGIGRELLTTRAAASCLKAAGSEARRLGAICVSVFESSLFIIREFVCVARETMKGRRLMRSGRLSFGSSSGVVVAGGVRDSGSGVEGREQMSVVQAERLLNDAEKIVVPLCKEVERLADGVWCGKTSSFSKQVCRQIRTACSLDSSDVVNNGGGVTNRNRVLGNIGVGWGQ